MTIPYAYSGNRIVYTDGSVDDLATGKHYDPPPFPDPLGSVLKFGVWHPWDDIRKHAGPIHPGTGTDQSVHAGISVLTVPIEGIDNTMSALPKTTATNIRAKSLEYLGTESEVKDRLRGFLDSAAQRPTSVTNSWRYWYENEHDWATDVAKRHGLSVEPVLGATAAMSSGMEWEKNKRMVDMLADVHTTNPNISQSVGDLELLQTKLDAYAERYGLNPIRLTSRTRFSTIKDPSLAAVSFYEISKQRGDPFPARYGYSTLADSISILRGQEPDSVLTGIKRRSFFNNLLANPTDPDVTIDVQMLQASSGTPFGDWRTHETESILIRSPSLSRTVDGVTRKDTLGVRPLIADYLRDLTVEYNGRNDDPWSDLLPRQTQAIIWSEWKEQFGRWGTERET